MKESSMRHIDQIQQSPQVFFFFIKYFFPSSIDLFRLLKTYKKIHKFANVISFFCTNDWIFTNDNVQKLWRNLNDEDKKLFYFDMQSLDWTEYITEYMKGMRVYLFKDDLSNAPQARKKWQRYVKLLAEITQYFHL